MDSDEGNSMRMEVADTVRVECENWKKFSGVLCDKTNFKSEMEGIHNSGAIAIGS